MENQDFFKFFEETKASLLKNTIVKITLGKPGSQAGDLENIYVRPVIIKNETVLSFTFRHKTRDITRNFTSGEGLAELQKALTDTFFQANLFTFENDFQLIINKKRNSKLIITRPTNPVLQKLTHDRIKKRLIKPENNIYLQELGITGKDEKVIPSMVDKFKQINKYVEIIDHTLEGIKKQASFSVADMGAGKGYLTFALYDHLFNSLKMKVQITGVEMRNDLVEKCNQVSEKAGFQNLKFVCSNINDFQFDKTDMLIALHACDTATDDAIYKGIKANAGYIVVAPCCHKQIRKEMSTGNLLEPMLKHGIFLERQAEMVTDGLRALMMELHGYQTKVFEFISTEHTPKNVMIIGTKHSRKVDEQKILEKIHSIKSFFGIEKHYLETLLIG